MSLFGYLIIMFDIMFWGFRVAGAVTTSLNIDFSVKPADLTTEIVILFITLLAIVFIMRRNIIGGVVYLITYGWYFGMDIINAIVKTQEGGALTTTEAVGVFMAAIGLLLAVSTFAYLVISLTRKGTSLDKKTDWFYKNKNFDRVYDERADRNKYKF